MVGRTDRNRVFTTEWVRYDHADGLLYTDAPVLITEAGVTYRGGGFRYDIRDRRFRLTGGASILQGEDGPVDQSASDSQRDAGEEPEPAGDDSKPDWIE